MKIELSLFRLPEAVARCCNPPAHFGQQGSPHSGFTLLPLKQQLGLLFITLLTVALNSVEEIVFAFLLSEVRDRLHILSGFADP